MGEEGTGESCSIGEENVTCSSDCSASTVYFSTLHLLVVNVCQCYSLFTEQATDASLASENWALNMEICDIINDTEDGPKDAIKAIRKRLTQNAGKNYTVVMYTLTVLETCVKNCGKRFHILACNKEFVQELVKLIGMQQVTFLCFCQVNCCSFVNSYKLPIKVGNHIFLKVKSHLTEVLEKASDVDDLISAHLSHFLHLDRIPR